ncbi:MAG: prepilin-type N-terminal cleavage/methylation domain-containing protein [Pyrinomonadaceae bacterium]|nr:prepilin-type N-terminal cleavage/methylation domain-containing protein [Pyrinomonadaceae bacterium]
MPTRMPNSRRPKTKGRSDAGFSLLEVVIAATILTIGLLAVASSIGYAMVAGNHGRAITNTKLLVVSVLEQMETLRNTGNLTFGQISNVGQVDNNGAGRNFVGFQTGFQQISTNPGPDGIFGTADDLIDAGPDGVFGNADDFVNPNLAVIGYTREIQITSLSPTLKKIQVTVSYPVNGAMKQLVAIGYLTNSQ